MQFRGRHIQIEKSSTGLLREDGIDPFSMQYRKKERKLRSRDAATKGLSERRIYKEKGVSPVGLESCNSHKEIHNLWI